MIRLGEWIGKVAEVPVGSQSLVRNYTSFAPGLFAGPALAPALDTARRIAAGDLPVIVEGETGTGKEGLCPILPQRQHPRPPKDVTATRAISQR
jgi:transcriptional regulator of aromatic amino acid metabolism